MVAKRKPKPVETPPPASANPEAEAALLGMILSARDNAFHEVADRLRAEDFHSERNQTIWRGMLALVASGRAIIRQVLLAEIGDATNSGDEIDLAGYLRALQAEGQKQTGSIGDFLEAVKSAATARELEAYGTWVKDELSKARITNIEDALAEAKHRLSLIGTTDGDDAKALSTVTETVVAETIKVRNKEKPPGLKTGLSFVDALVGSFRPGQLIVIAGPAGAGKSALGFQIGLMLAQAGSPAHAFSLEMESEEIAARMLAQFSKVETDKIADGDVTDEQLASLDQANRDMRDVPFYIDPRTRPTTSTLLTRASRSKSKNGTMIFMTDHLRMVRPDNPRAEERERLEQIVQDHKSMAKRLGVPWILLAHTSRTDTSNVRTAKDIRLPNMHSLYGSSAVENTADVVLFVHRPWMILQDCKPSHGAKHYNDWEADCERWRGKAQIVLGKRRAGKGRGLMNCRFDAVNTWFAPREEDPPAYTGEAPT